MSNTPFVVGGHWLQTSVFGKVETIMKLFEFDSRWRPLWASICC